MADLDLTALTALRGVIAAFADARDDDDWIVRTESSIDDLGTTPGLTWGDLRAIEAQVREQVAREIEALRGTTATFEGRLAVGVAAQVARGSSDA